MPNSAGSSRNGLTFWKQTAVNSRNRLAAKKFSGKFVPGVAAALRRRLAAKALAVGESLNSFCVKTLLKA